MDSVNSSFPLMDLTGIPTDQLSDYFKGAQGPLMNWYDFKLYDTVRLQPNVLLPASQVDLFQNAVGQQQSIFGTASTMYTKQLSDTNIRSGGFIPKGRFMIVNSIEVICPLVANLATVSSSGQNIELNTVQGIGTATSPGSDARTLLTQGYGYFYYGTKKFQEGQLLAFGATEGISGYGFGIGATTGQTLQVDGVANNGSLNYPWLFQSPHGIQQQMNFQFTIQFFNPFTVLAATSQVIKVSLNGMLCDPVM